MKYWRYDMVKIIHDNHYDIIDIINSHSFYGYSQYIRQSLISK